MILREKIILQEEIAQKSLSLRGKLESFTSIENKECLKKAGLRKLILYLNGYVLKALFA